MIYTSELEFTFLNKVFWFVFRTLDDFIWGSRDRAVESGLDIDF